MDNSISIEVDSIKADRPRYSVCTLVTEKSQYEVQVLSEKGKSLVKNRKLLTRSSETNEKTRIRINQEAHQKIVKKYPFTDLSETLAAKFSSEIWDEAAFSCLGCGICTYLCPTCHCFDINDCTHHDKAKRVRTWDTCQFSSYSIHTSGHNPRPQKSNRLRNRIFHKFKYHQDNFNETGCVGCGRCLTYCPVNLDMKTIITELETEKAL